jgi:hypothetical protein
MRILWPLTFYSDPALAYCVLKQSNEVLYVLQINHTFECTINTFALINSTRIFHLQAKVYAVNSNQTEIAQLTIKFC